MSRNDGNVENSEAADGNEATTEDFFSECRQVDDPEANSTNQVANDDSSDVSSVDSDDSTRWKIVEETANPKAGDVPAVAEASSKNQLAEDVDPPANEGDDSGANVDVEPDQNNKQGVHESSVNESGLDDVNESDVDNMSIDSNNIRVVEDVEDHQGSNADAERSEDENEGDDVLADNDGNSAKVDGSSVSALGSVDVQSYGGKEASFARKLQASKKQLSKKKGNPSPVSAVVTRHRSAAQLAIQQSDKIKHLTPPPPKGRCTTNATLISLGQQWVFYPGFDPVSWEYTRQGGYFYGKSARDTVYRNIRQLNQGISMCVKRFIQVEMPLLSVQLKIGKDSGMNVMSVVGSLPCQNNQV